MFGAQVFRTADVDEMISISSRSLSAHRLILKDRHAFNGRLSRAQIGAISINHLSYGTELEVRAESMGDDLFFIEVPLSGESVTSLGVAKVIGNASTGCILSPDTAFSSIWSADCTKLLIKIGRVKAEQHLRSLTGADLRKPLRFDMEMHFGSDAVRPLRGLIDVLLAEAAVSESQCDRAPFHRCLETAFLTALIWTQPHNYSSQLERLRKPAAVPWYVRRAESYIKVHSSRQLSLDEIAADVGVSARTLQIGFRQFRGVSPMAYLRNYRLDQVMMRLEHANGKAKVCDFARSAGFVDMSKFARAYRIRFGCGPRETLRNRAPPLSDLSS
ncbi:AraC family transcriptional regulator [Bradyrhizobium sp. CCBAU 53338]|uniref:AraC family transcriptional regulator n=1 Tax=Bradyrhizobium sp. CCBAU 53338 TaxID=1325111 RepID=UPI00188AA5F4|nr:AraC family transcriptional regulator [Bradyrhizobium sp. CCBAU 53338]